MDLFSRIRPAMDVDRLQDSEVTLIGAGGSAPIAYNLARCGLGRLNLVDPQTIEGPNIARQDHLADRIGVPKVEAVKQHALRINDQMEVKTFVADICAFSDEKIDSHFGQTDLFIAATDHFPAQARVNEIALRLGKAALWVGLYAGARAGEVALWHPGIDSCYRCLCAKRYQAYAQAQQEGRSLDPTSDGADIFSIQFLDAIAGQLAVGLLTRGADNRFGRLIDQLGQGEDARNFLQVKLDPAYTFNGRDLFREQLKIPEQNPAYFSWLTIARSDNWLCQSGCRDCCLYRGHYWISAGHGPIVRVRPDSECYNPAEATRQRDIYLSHPTFHKSE